MCAGGAGGRPGRGPLWAEPGAGAAGPHGRDHHAEIRLHALRPDLRALDRLSRSVGALVRRIRALHGVAWVCARQAVLLHRTALTGPLFRSGPLVRFSRRCDQVYLLVEGRPGVYVEDQQTARSDSLSRLADRGRTGAALRDLPAYWYAPSACLLYHPQLRAPRYLR